MLLSLLILLLSPSVYAEPDRLCKVIDIISCGNVTKYSSRSSGASNPTLVGASTLNPSAALIDRGFGIETLMNGNSFDLGVAASSGRIGGTFTLGAPEDSFFSTRGLEPSKRTEERRDNLEKYDNDKISLSGGFNLFGKSKGSSKSKFISNIGLTIKRDPDVKKIKAGAGISFIILQKITLGYSYLNDATYFEINDLVTRLERSGAVATNTIARSGTYDFNNQIISAGFHYKAMSFEYFHITQKILSSPQLENLDNEKILIRIYSASFFLSRWILTFARRFETSKLEKYNYIKQSMESTPKSNQTFMGIQYNFKPRWMVGILSNYYLNESLTLTLTAFL